MRCAKTAPGEVVVQASGVWFCDQRDGRVWHGTGHRPAAPVDLDPGPGPGSAGARYSDLHTPGGQDVVCVRERDLDGQSRSDIIRVGLGGPAEVLAAGADFHAAPASTRPAGGWPG